MLACNGSGPSAIHSQVARLQFSTNGPGKTRGDQETSAPSSNKRDAVLEPLAELTSTTAVRSRDLVGVGGSPKQARFTLATADGVEDVAGAEGSR